MVNTRNYKLLCSLILTGILSVATRIDANTQIDVTLPSTDSAKKKSRMRKTHSEKTVKEKKIYTYRDMDYDQLLVAKDAQLAAKNNSAVIKYLEQLIKICPDVAKKSDHLIEIADLMVQEGMHEKAALVYTEHSLLYPGSDQKQYVLSQAIESLYACTLPSDRDQSKTEETLALTEVYLSQDHFDQYRDEVSRIRAACNEKLVESECNVCSFYVSRGRFAAAQKRMEKIRTVWLPRQPTIEPQLLALEAEYAEKKDAFELTQQKNTEVVQKSDTLQLADNKKTKRMVERF